MHLHHFEITVPNLYTVVVNLKSECVMERVFTCGYMISLIELLLYMWEIKQT